jgi:chromate reductase
MLWARGDQMESAMTDARPIAVIVGSLRRASFSRRLAGALVKLAPASLSCAFVEIRELPLYDQDLDDDHRPPPAWTYFRERIRSFEGVLFVTPEYNRSIPGGLKNALDVGSRPYGQSVWDNKPCAVVSNSPGAIGGFGANHHLRQSLAYLNMPTLGQPEAYVGRSDTLVDAAGDITNEGTRKFLAGLMTAFDEWLVHFQRVKA